MKRVRAANRPKAFQENSKVRIERSCGAPFTWSLSSKGFCRRLTVWKWNRKSILLSSAGVGRCGHIPCQRKHSDTHIWCWRTQVVSLTMCDFTDWSCWQVFWVVTNSRADWGLPPFQKQDWCCHSLLSGRCESYESFWVYSERIHKAVRPFRCLGIQIDARLSTEESPIEFLVGWWYPGAESRCATTPWRSWKAI